MRTSRQAVLHAVWNFLTVIPGWPDAGRTARVLYVLPVAVPVVALAGLAAWAFLVRGPEIRRVRTAGLPGMQVEAEIAALERSGAEMQSTAAGPALERARRLALGDAAQVAARLAEMRAGAATHGWSATLHAGELVPPAEGELLAHRTIRGRLLPEPGNTTPFNSLLALLDEFFPSDVHGNLVRLTIRADDQGSIGADFGALHAVCPPDEKAP